MSVVENNSSDNDERIVILDPIDETKIDFLPATALTGWTTWVLSTNGQFMKIPDTKDGYVDPVSQSTLWQAVDLKYPKVQLALGLHIMNGQMRHIFPALDVFFDDGLHRNRGLNTVPRAHTWVSINNNSKGTGSSVDIISFLSSFSLELSTRNFKTGEKQWTSLSTSLPIKDALEKTIYSLADSPPPELGSGSHIVHVLLAGQEIISCPKVGQELLSTLHAPSRQDHSTGILSVKISATQAGSTSKFLPDVYNELFTNPIWQRSEYREFKKRQEERKKKDQEDALQRRKERDGEL